jgi:hypothetical protein
VSAAPKKREAKEKAKRRRNNKKIGAIDIEKIIELR